MHVFCSQLEIFLLFKKVFTIYYLQDISCSKILELSRMPNILKLYPQSCQGMKAMPKFPAWIFLGYCLVVETNLFTISFLSTYFTVCHIWPKSFPKTFRGCALESVHHQCYAINLAFWHLLMRFLTVKMASLFF